MFHVRVAALLLVKVELEEWSYLVPSLLEPRYLFRFHFGAEFAEERGQCLTPAVRIEAHTRVVGDADERVQAVQVRYCAVELALLPVHNAIINAWFT